MRETDEKEWLDVYLRTIRYTYLDDPEYVARRRELARSEVRLVLGRAASNLWPEPIDLLEIPNSRDAFAFSQSGVDTEPITVVARPHGQLLTDWQRQSRPVSATLAVLAELLEFIDQVHQDGLLLHGMGPASILIDRAQRIHYVGTDMVMADIGARTCHVAGAVGQALSGRPFPARLQSSRVFCGAQPRDLAGARRSDLYAWGCLVYFLLTDLTPERIALDQGRSWAHFQNAHFAVAGKQLNAVPDGAGGKLAGTTRRAQRWRRRRLAWPGAFLGLMKLLLHPDPRRRPGSVAELRRWLAAPPPPMVAAVLALRTGPTEARVFLDAEDMDPKLQIVASCAWGRAPTGLRRMAIWFRKGPRARRSTIARFRQPRVRSKTRQSVYYAAFTRLPADDEACLFPSAVAELLDPSRGNRAAAGRDGGGAGCSIRTRCPDAFGSASGPWNRRSRRRLCSPRPSR